MSPLAARVKNVSMLSPSPLAHSPISRSPLGPGSPSALADPPAAREVKDVLDDATTAHEAQEETPAPAVAEEEPLVVDEQDELASADEGELDLEADSAAEQDPSPAPSPTKDASSQLSTPRANGIGGGKENEAPTPEDGAHAEADDDEAYTEADEFGLDKSMVIRSGTKSKKTKRRVLALSPCPRPPARDARLTLSLYLSALAASSASRCTTSTTSTRSRASCRPSARRRAARSSSARSSSSPPHPYLSSSPFAFRPSVYSLSFSLFIHSYALTLPTSTFLASSCA